MIDHDSPRIVTSRRRIVYRPSAWKLHYFEIWSGELVCKAAVLRANGSLFLWLGSGAGEPELGDVSLGVPATGSSQDGCRRAGLATALVGAESTITAMARRLAAFMQQPVYVCSSNTFDRFIEPLVERGLIAEIKSRPECF
ncbi:uncharacterized protein ACR2FA_009687 [Aphomia sociella]